MSYQQRGTSNKKIFYFLSVIFLSFVVSVEENADRKMSGRKIRQFYQPRINVSASSRRAANQTRIKINVHSRELKKLAWNTIGILGKSEGEKSTKLVSYDCQESLVSSIGQKRVG